MFGQLVSCMQFAHGIIKLHSKCDNYLTLKFGLKPASAVLRRLIIYMYSKVLYEIYKC